MFYVLAATAVVRLAAGCVEGARWATDTLVARKQKAVNAERAARLADLLQKAEQEGKKRQHYDVLISMEDVIELSKNETFMRSRLEYDNLVKAGAFGGERT